MARRRSARVTYNRRTHSALRLGLADGLLQVAEVIVQVADPPDATPFGEGLVTTGAAGAWVDGRKVGGSSPKPRHSIPRTGVAAIAGFGFPGRFQELGTIHQAPQPFLMPAVDAVVPNTGAIMRPFVSARLRWVG
jgi:hypothetical protein